jgi:hypothetical protein
VTINIGDEFGRYTVVERVENYRNHRRFLCRCECGNTKVVRSDHLTRGSILSCGCYNKDKNIELHSTHHMTNTRLFYIWQSMKQRCYDTNCNTHKNYGARGISICDEWLNDFICFYNWSIGNGYSDELSIDRIDVDGNYEPSNCRWATRKEQIRNRRNTKYVTHNEETKALPEWCEIYGINYDKAKGRLRLGWSFEKIFEID